MSRNDYTELHRRLLAFYEANEASQWMNSPHRLLNGRRPVDCLFTEVDVILSSLEDGAFT